MEAVEESLHGGRGRRRRRRPRWLSESVSNNPIPATWESFIPMPPPTPAHATKHIPLLSYPFASSTFHLAQLNDGASNGTALWLGAQCLSIYLASIHHKLTPPSATRPRVVELGSGIGLTACANPPSTPLYSSISLYLALLSVLSAGMFSPLISPMLSQPCLLATSSTIYP